MKQLLCINLMILFLFVAYCLAQDNFKEHWSQKEVDKRTKRLQVERGATVKGISGLRRKVHITHFFLCIFTFVSVLTDTVGLFVV